LAQELAAKGLVRKIAVWEHDQWPSGGRAARQRQRPSDSLRAAPGAQYDF
jgi:hypothetical protein